MLASRENDSCQLDANKINLVCRDFAKLGNESHVNVVVLQRYFIPEVISTHAMFSTEIYMHFLPLN